MMASVMEGIAAERKKPSALKNASKQHKVGLLYVLQGFRVAGVSSLLLGPAEVLCKNRRTLRP